MIDSLYTGLWKELIDQNRVSVRIHTGNVCWTITVRIGFLRQLDSGGPHFGLDVSYVLEI